MKISQILLVAIAWPLCMAAASSPTSTIASGETMIRSLLIITAAALLGAGAQDPLPAFQGLQIPADEIDSKKVDALRGSGLAAFRLYNYYDVVRLDREESFYWVTISAENDYPSGMYALGFRLAERRDASSRTRARYWLEKAERNGEPLARDILNRLKD